MVQVEGASILPSPVLPFNHRLSTSTSLQFDFLSAFLGIRIESLETPFSTGRARRSPGLPILVADRPSPIALLKPVCQACTVAMRQVRSRYLLEYAKQVGIDPGSSDH